MHDINADGSVSVNRIIIVLSMVHGFVPHCRIVELLLFAILVKTMYYLNNGVHCRSENPAKTSPQFPSVHSISFFALQVPLQLASWTSQENTFRIP